VFAVILAAGVAASLAGLHDLAFFSSDAAQYLSTARNVANGQGLTSDLVYYDEQYAFGSLPAPQTVFPPGLPILLAPLLAVGFEPGWASFAAGAASLALTGLILGIWLIRLKVTAPLVLLGVASWFCLALASVNVLLGLSEVVFTALSTAAVFVILSRGSGGWRLLIGGALAAAAVSVRYQSIFFLVALALWGCFFALTRSEGRLLPAGRTVMAILALPALVAAAVVGRNIVLIGAAGGGPVDTVRAGVGAIGSVRHLYWALNDIGGLSVSRSAGDMVEEALVVAGLLLLALGIGWGRAALRGTSVADSDSRRERRELIGFVLVYASITLAGLLYLGATRAGAYLQGRYLVSLAPFVLLAWLVLVDRVWTALPGRLRVMVGAGLVLVHAGLLAGQAGVAHRWLADLRADRRIEVMRSALAARVDGSTLRTYLQEHATARSPVFAESGQHLWLLLERPILAPAAAGFSRTQWTAEELRRLQNCYGVEHVLFFPRLFDPALPHNANRVLFAELSRGQLPDFMQPVMRSADAELYRLAPDPGGTCSTPRGKR
jgi:hypothetical protein